MWFDHEHRDIMDIGYAVLFFLIVAVGWTAVICWNFGA